MATLTKRPADEGFLLSEATGFRSREAVTLKAGHDYEAGSVLIAEYTQSEPGDPEADPPVAASGYDTATGKYVLATAALVSAYETDDAVILCRHTNATAADVDAAAIARDAEVKDTELVVGSATTVADVKAVLAANGIRIRTAI